MTTSPANPDRERIATLIAFILLCLIVFLLSSCGTSYHLRRAEQHLKKAELKGANVRTDTVYKLDTIYFPVVGVETDTIFQSIPGDTVEIEKERLRIKYVEMPGDSVYIEGECEADTVIQVRNIPVEVRKEISSGLSVWDVVILCIVVAVVAYILGMFRKNRIVG